MNKNILGLMLGLALVSSCSKDEQSVFEQTPAERTTASISELQRTLQSSVYGWEMSMFPERGSGYGGYTTFVLFGNDGEVTIADELQNDPKEVKKSLYTIDNSNGTTLTFNTYNASMHRYSEPNSPIFNENRSRGADGDYSFQLISMSPEKVVLRGIRSGSIAELRPLTTANWEPLVRAYKQASQTFYLASSEVSINGEKATNTAMLSDRHLTFSYKGVDYDLPFRYTDKGISLYQPLTIDGVTIQDLTQKGDSEQINLTDASEKFSLAYKFIITDYLLNSTWVYNEEDATGRFKDAITNMNRHLQRFYRGRVDAGSLRFGSVGAYVAVYTDKFYYNESRSDLAFLYLTPEVVSENEVKFTFNRSASTASSADMQSPIFIQARLSQMLASGFSNVGNVSFTPRASESVPNPTTITYYTDNNDAGRTFILTSDPATIFPTWIKLVDKSDENNTLTLRKAG